MSRNSHNGTTIAIRQMLQQSPVPLRQAFIAKKLGISHAQCVSALNHMISRLGGACLAGRDGRFRLYGVPGRDDVKSGPQRVNVATGRYLAPPGAVLQRDPFEHRSVAMAGPR